MQVKILFVIPANLRQHPRLFRTLSTRQLF